ncbi:MAG: hypothetical protein OCD02_17710 [Spirochaetaceae bacterium]
MNKKNVIIFTIIMVIILNTCTVSKKGNNSNDLKNVVLTNTKTYTGKIYLYGETHGDKRILEKEFDIWYDFYQKGFRDLFIELSYFTGEYLNLWMQTDNDSILNVLYSDWEGSASHNPYSLEFYQKIKENCPETVFHGTDVGHQHDSTGQRYLKYLKANNLEYSKKYKLTKEAILQGIRYNGSGNDVYRENTMVENFIRELEKLSNKDIMGIYGAAHTGLNDMDFTGKVSNMTSQLKSEYGDLINSENLFLWSIIEPIRVDTIIVEDNEYNASY